MTNKAKGSKKNRKYGRNKLKCDSYRRDDQGEKNAGLRRERHQRRLERFNKRATARAVP